MNNSIYPCITLKGKVAEAADFYINTFGDGKIAQTSPYVIQIELSGQKLMLLNDGPSSKPNPAMSFMVSCRDVAQTEKYWNTLIEGGSVMMPLDTYPWSPKYGWVQDKYGVSWQLNTTDLPVSPKFSPTLMFVQQNAGKAAEAMKFYTSLFPNSSIKASLNYEEGEGDNTEFVKHASFEIDGFDIIAMDSGGNHQFTFVDALSLVVECSSQAEIDKYWNELSSNGGHEIQCGWLTDKYGISWQIIPKKLGALISDPERGQRAMGAMLKMKKLVIAELENA